MAEVLWRFHVRASGESAARRVLALVEKKLERELRIETVERYWKVSELQVASARSSLIAESFADAVLEALARVGSVASR